MPALRQWLCTHAGLNGKVGDKVVGVLEAEDCSTVDDLHLLCTTPQWGKCLNSLTVLTALKISNALGVEPPDAEQAIASLSPARHNSPTAAFETGEERTPQRDGPRQGPRAGASRLQPERPRRCITFSGEVMKAACTASPPRGRDAELPATSAQPQSEVVVDAACTASPARGRWSSEPATEVSETDQPPQRSNSLARSGPSRSSSSSRPSLSSSGSPDEITHRLVPLKVSDLEASAEDKFTQLWAQADQLTSNGNPRKGADLSKEAIELAPDRPEAHFVLGNAYMKTGRQADASESFLSAMVRYRPGRLGWAVAACQACVTRERAVTCGSSDIFCGCESCAALPEKPEWMRSPEDLVAMAKLVVMAAPESALSWRMHAGAHMGIGDHATASKSYAKAAQLNLGRGEKGAGACLVSMTRVVKAQ